MTLIEIFDALNGRKFTYLDAAMVGNSAVCR
jgi:hypothetical protein